MNVVRRPPHESAARRASCALARGLLLVTLALAGCRSPGESALAAAVERAPGLELRFEGSSYPRSTLLDAIALDLGDLGEDGLDRPQVDDLAYGLEVFLRRQGFREARVDYRFESDAEDGARATFLVEEGARSRVERLAFEGLPGGESFDEERLRAFFGSPERLFGKTDWWLVQSELQSGTGALEDFLWASGHLDAVVQPPQIDWLDETRARVTISVTAGPRWVLGAVELDTPPSLAGERRAELASLLEAGRRELDGGLRPYTLRLAYEIRARLLERCGEWGYADAQCAVEERPLEPGRMLVRFSLDPGPRVRVGSILLIGATKTRPGFLRSRLTLQAGDLLDTRALRTSFSRLFDAGLFRTVTIEAVPRADEPPEAEEVVRDLHVRVRELPSLELTVEPGYGSYELFRVRLGIEDHNVLGTGRTLEAATTLGPLAQRASIGTGDRSLFGSDLAGSSALFYNRREEPSFTSQERGLALALSRTWEESDLDVSLAYRFRRSDVSDVQVVDELVEEALADVDIASLVLTAARDTRDRFFTPSDGSFLRAQVEWAATALGSEVDFLSARVEASTFRRLPWDGGVLGVGVETGAIAPLGSTDVLPLQVRLFNGGENTVRSFREDELGNLDSDGEPIGGEAFTVLSLELRQALAGPLSGAAFYDAGNLETEHAQYLDFDDMRQALGVGLRYALPIGPVRVDVAWNPDRRGAEDNWVVHVSVGLSF